MLRNSLLQPSAVPDAFVLQAVASLVQMEVAAVACIGVCVGLVAAAAPAIVAGPHVAAAATGGLTIRQPVQGEAVAIVAHDRYSKQAPGLFMQSVS